MAFPSSFMVRWRFLVMYGWLLLVWALRGWRQRAGIMSRYGRSGQTNLGRSPALAHRDVLHRRAITLAAA
jgi:hypothetical protein